MLLLVSLSYQKEINWLQFLLESLVDCFMNSKGVSSILVFYYEKTGFKRTFLKVYLLPNVWFWNKHIIQCYSLANLFEQLWLNLKISFFWDVSLFILAMNPTKQTTKTWNKLCFPKTSKACFFWLWRGQGGSLQMQSFCLPDSIPTPVLLWGKNAKTNTASQNDLLPRRHLHLSSLCQMYSLNYLAVLAIFCHSLIP